MVRYSEDDSLPRQILFLTVSTKISAPPPGRESNPADFSLDNVSSTESPLLDAICLTSTAVNDLMCI